MSSAVNMKGALMLWITFLTFWMTCGVTGAPTKYLFTAPRNLWQGSREEFCISFHDDKDIQANYLVTLSLADESDVVLGNGTTNEEGRVCHHFKVPDLSGNHKLTLQTETTRILDTGFSATVKRVDSTEVEIHESALETFIQTDKPIYKPGETVKFRAMTINKDLKPWTGMVPLVTVKNPGDVRVMQWLNVENNKGLLSFEMPLSEDPPLGEWKITMLVEGKEHVQLFTVEEYVLPKYEVTITAPTFLLPTTETIQGTVCAKYTYGKPVKGKVEISVCFQDTSPYFYYYRSRDNSERPCANRIMDIDGCETYIVDGSELMLDSSNFSRYGNLMINATVTEHVTGISLNGTVKGPEMTFEAVKLKFEDDTHGYFKDAFPYYARVIVTKPDGSPAPGELIEIKADNYDPEFHLKRNFTSDDNGLVKFAIKTLPKDVNRLSFNARAPKYFQPYGRYHHIIKMYEPSSYHNAQKWFSPSNSYIHIPSVENKVKCGSTLDLDVLYSTTLDTRYKFFVQVLSKSHMVHHTHVKHHFKSHDAVNFDSLPDDMLLDPYTPPPRPTWLYPIDPIPYYDDPELGYKPEAENTTISLDGVEGTAEVKPEPVPSENKTMGLNQKEKRSVELDEEEKEEPWFIRKKRNTEITKPTIQKFPNDIATSEGQTVEFVCEVAGDWGLQVIWKKEGGKISHLSTTLTTKTVGPQFTIVNQTLRIENVTRHDTGIYICAAQNLVGEVEAVARLVVNIAPEIEMLNKRIGQYAGKEVILECSITAIPNNYASWLFKGQAILKSDRHTINVYEDDKYSVRWSMSIKSLKTEDFGKYTCVAENHLGKAEESINLYELHRSCDMMAVQTCMMPVARINPGNVKEMCQVYETMEVCIKPYRTSCKGQLTSLASLKDMYNSMCKSKCDMVELSKCMEPMIKLEGNSMLQICKKFAELKTCIGPYWNDCKESTEIKSVSNVLDSYNTLCPEKKASKKEICTKLFRPNFNTSASVLPGDRMTASNTGDVDDCARACNKENKCLGFNYHIHGTCELFFKNYLTAKKDGVDYYERQCYTDDSKDIIKSTHVAKVKISIPITANMGPKSELLIYYVREDDETVAATLEFSVENCFDNKVEMKFDQDTVYPGNEVNINLKAAPGSLCSVGVVDKSINLLAGNHQITPDQIFGRFKEPNIYTSYWQDDKKYCDEKTHYDESLYQGDMYSYNYRSYESDSVDAIQAFRKMNLVVFTDLTLQTRPCKVQIHRPVYFSEYDIGNRGVAWRGQIQPDAARKESVTTEQIDSSDAVRSHFPETWLWSIYMIGDDGEVNVTSTIPHTITEWVGNSLCTNLDVGVGVSSVTGITAFQPFFLSFTLPYSAIRGETVPILVSIFNYMTECLVMQVALPTSKDFGIKGGANRVYTRCVCPGETRTIKYHVIPYTLGKIKVLATAESIPDDGTCGNNSVSVDGTGANDAVQRELLIEAEGIEKEYTATSYICPEGAEVTESMLLPLPSTDLVEDSARGYINIIGDIMGPALSNLKDLLQMPYGCGEQNMASFSPNIFALQYLGNTNQLLPKIEDEAKGYMRIGYQRQLKYRHDDGSYSAFGGTGSGSIWLTSFVVKCLGQSRPYISIDADDLNKSITWFRRQQLENGCFPKIGYTHSYYLKGGFSDRSNEASLTAFVLIAMLEAGIPSSDPSVIKAVRCLDVQDIPDTYTMAIMAYAYTLYDLRHLRRQQVIKMLDERATVKDGMKYWSRTEKKEDAKKKQKWYYTAVSAEVEMTAYALLAHVTGEQQNAATNARPMVMWLTKQRNPRGGFSSTQDTIVALQALARYATLVYQGGVNVSIEMMEKNKKNPDRTTTFSIDDDNTLVLQSERISILPSTLEAKVSGVGCAMVQANVKYNVYETPTSPTFDMKVSVYRAKDHANQCSRRTLSICVKFTGPGGVSNMAIVDVKMVTGWVPVKDSLKKLIVEKNDPTYIGVEKYEVDGSYVHIYFDQLDSTRKCFLVDVEQNIELSAPKPAQVKVYDYYETDFTLIVNYKIKTTCGTKEELPYISAEQYYNGILVNLPVDEIVQVRVPPRLEGSGLFRPISQQQTCPMCYKSVDTTSKIFKSMVCGSKKIYKVQTGRRGKYTLKMYANVRTKKKEVVNKFVKKNYNSDCTCDLMNGQKGKVLVFSERDTLDTKTRTLTINGSSKIVKVSKALEKAVWRLVRKKRCR
ncbi:alpha-2-macroglobulin-like isoform X3 [Mytilus californianus]|uniref:alpha-2-macroglobulin-like isoform X3 n=1 Tax=Mytilus californianus TaxID=6549 RepID=UPI002247EFB0|nr:alpha-2-macroglobulin-like isoform X3 [Mytilus californianus]